MTSVSGGFLAPAAPGRSCGTRARLVLGAAAERSSAGLLRSAVWTELRRGVSRAGHTAGSRVTSQGLGGDR